MTDLPSRRAFLAIATGAGLAALAGSPAAAQSSPSAATIERRLQAAPQIVVPPQKRVTVEQFKRRRDLRRAAPSIDIQTINFRFGSADIAPSQDWKIGEIAIAMRRILDRNPREVFLVEGHTDAVGSNLSNLRLSQARAGTVARRLVRFGVPPRALEAIGYGEEDLLIPTEREEWRNRRVTLRRITEFVTPY